MKSKYILSLFSVALLAVSCYEDKGNYDYTTLNQATVTFELEDTKIPFGSEVKISPKLTFESGVESSSLSYEWRFCGKVISTERNLKWSASPISKGNLALYVKDNNTGLSYISDLYIDVIDKYQKQGWMILSEKDGKSMLSYVSEGRTVKIDSITKKRYVECTPDVNAYFKNNNNMDMGTQPVKFLEHFRNKQWEDPDMGNFWILQKGGQGVIDINGSSLTNDVTLEEQFIGGLPAGFVPYDIIDLSYLTLVVSEDGKVYSRKKEDVEQYNSGLFTNLTMKDDKGREIDGRFFVRSPYAESALALFYNAPTNNYLVITTRAPSWTGTPYAGRILPVKASEAEYAKNPNFTRFEDLGTKKPIFIGPYKDETSSGSMCFVSILKDTETGKHFIQDFILSGLSYSNATTPTMIDQSEIDLSGIIDGVSRNVFHQSNYRADSPALFISKGKELWFIYLGNTTYTKTLHYTFDSDIMSMNSEMYGGRQLAVGLENGKFHIIDSSWDALNKVHGDNINLFSLDGLGKILQVNYKLVNDNQWVPWL